MGTPAFAVPTLQALVQAGHEICLVVTQPDKAKGRGKMLQAPPMKEAAESLGIPVYQPVKVRAEDSVEYLRTFQADAIIVIAFGQILPKSILELTPYGCINVHSSLLPKYRGAAPIQWALLSGETVTGVTTMLLDEGIDTGDMLLSAEIAIDPKETAGTLHDKLAQLGALLIVETLEQLEEGALTPIPQEDSPTAYARMLSKDMGKINWSMSAIEIERWIRGLHPWPSAYTHLADKVIKILQSEVTSEEELQTLEIHLAQPGTIIGINTCAFYVQTGDGVLRVDQIQVSGKKAMTVQAFLLGHKLPVGLSFH